MSNKKEYLVIVTAFAPFEENKTNPTQHVKVEIPNRIERAGQVPIRVIKFPTDFRNVVTDMDIVLSLWNQDRNGYDWVGDDGLELPRHNGGKGGRWEGLPEVLEPVFDVDEVVRLAEKEQPKLNVKTSTNSGFKYCEFLCYSSLVTLYRREETARSLFLHHPGKKTTSDDTKHGAQVAMSVIASMAEQLEGM